jgi:DNA-3-methyladenine glycosylase
VNAAFEPAGAPEEPGRSAPAGWQPLPRGFFERPIVDLARSLLGQVLVRLTHDGLVAGAIVETEAYGGPDDLASHARAGLTRRTAPMFGPAGHAYVYLVYGIHHCVNVVGERDGRPGAVLLRALEPIAGLDLMRARHGDARPGTGPRADAGLASGPGRLCRALAIDRGLDGADLTETGSLWLASPGGPPGEHPDALAVASGPRVGVAYAGPDWGLRAWRFGIAGHPSLSRPFAAGLAA